MQIRSLLALLLIIGLCVSCSSDDTPPETDATDSVSDSTSTGDDVSSDTDGTTSTLSERLDDRGGSCEPLPTVVDNPDLDCADDERPAGERCYFMGDRTCLTHSHCREERECCVFDPPTANRGRCIYTPREERACPGSPDCPDADASASLQAGFFARTITPRGFEVARPANQPGSGYSGSRTDPEDFCDCGREMRCPETPEYEDCPSLGTPDGTETGAGDGMFQPIWLAGFANDRPAKLCPPELVADTCEGPECCVSPFAHDDIWVRGVVVEQDGLRIALLSLDLIGFFYSDIRPILDNLDPELGLDHVLISSTHTHSAPDTLGQWGPTSGGLPSATGVDKEWLAFVQEEIALALADGVEALEDADIYAANVDTGYEGFALGDSRDPWIWDDRLTLLHFVRAGGDRFGSTDTLGVMANWHSHPEALTNGNPYITSDFPHFFREAVENGLPEIETIDGETLDAIPGLGGIAVYFSGAVGGLLGPIGRGAIGRDGVEHVESGFPKAHALGERLGWRTLEALRDEEQSEAIEGQALSFAEREFMLDVQNVLFQQAFLQVKIIQREIYNWRPADGTIRASRYPQIRTMVSQIRLGNVTFQSVPGEIFPESVVGYSPDNAFGNPIMGDPDRLECGPDLMPLPDGEIGEFPCLVRPNNEHPPPLEDAPTEGFLRETLPGDYHMIIGLGHDMLGYIVPLYDFVVTRGVPYVNAAPGDHYEETNGLGPVHDIIMDEINALFDQFQE